MLLILKTTLRKIPKSKDPETQDTPKIIATLKIITKNTVTTNLSPTMLPRTTLTNLVKNMKVRNILALIPHKTHPQATISIMGIRTINLNYIRPSRIQWARNSIIPRE